MTSNDLHLQGICRICGKMTDDCEDVCLECRGEQKPPPPYDPNPRVKR